MRTITTSLLGLLLTLSLLLAATPAAEAAGTPPPRRLGDLTDQRDAARERAETLAVGIRRVTNRLEKTADVSLVLRLQRAELVHRLAVTRVQLEDDEAFLSPFERVLASDAYEELVREEAAVARRDGKVDGTREKLTSRRVQLVKKLQATRKKAQRTTAAIKDLKQLRPEVHDHRGAGMVEVGGIVVKAELGEKLAALLWHARADGHDLTGFGWRSRAKTVKLRKVNGCPDVNRAPPSACRVPTALPGTSMHETGLAIDFRIDGQSICFPRASAACSHPAFRWLQANAGAYGLRNLPSEAWHWSTTGR